MYSVLNEFIEFILYLVNYLTYRNECQTFLMKNYLPFSVAGDTIILQLQPKKGGANFGG